MRITMTTRERVLRYREEHPVATVREIQVALGLSSPSVVQFHLAGGCRRAQLEAALREARTPFASTLSHEAALERLREINRLTYAALGDGRPET